jgi:hypothetical protein
MMNIDKGESDLRGQKRIIEPPKVGRIGTKKIAWTNFMSNCKRSSSLQRNNQSMKHLSELDKERRMRENNVLNCLFVCLFVCLFGDV